MLYRSCNIILCDIQYYVAVLCCKIYLDSDVNQGQSENYSDACQIYPLLFKSRLISFPCY